MHDRMVEYLPSLVNALKELINIKLLKALLITKIKIYFGDSGEKQYSIKSAYCIFAVSKQAQHYKPMTKELLQRDPELRFRLECLRDVPDPQDLPDVKIPESLLAPPPEEDRS